MKITILSGGPATGKTRTAEVLSTVDDYDVVTFFSSTQVGSISKLLYGFKKPCLVIDDIHFKGWQEYFTALLEGAPERLYVIGTLRTSDPKLSIRHFNFTSGWIEEVL